MREDGFLRSILDNPKDDTPFLVYADWLEEQGDAVAAAKAEFLRLTVGLSAQPDAEAGQRDLRSQRLQLLAAELDTAWLAVVSRLPIESCQGKKAEVESKPFYAIRFSYLCDRRWEDLSATDDQAVRFCDACNHNVHYCDTITEAREHAVKGNCISVDLGVIRRPDDLEPERHWLGRPSVEMLREEQERIKPDAVSAERERKKRGSPAAGTKSS
jgi:uncharacterized protein (TIGR02996 family)